MRVSLGSIGAAIATAVATAGLAPRVANATGLVAIAVLVVSAASAARIVSAKTAVVAFAVDGPPNPTAAGVLKFCSHHRSFSILFSIFLIS